MIVKPPATTTVRASPRRAPMRDERRGGSRGDESADADAVEVHPQRRHHHRVAVQPEHEDGHHSKARQEDDGRFRQAPLHLTRYRPCRAELEAFVQHVASA